MISSHSEGGKKCISLLLVKMFRGVSLLSSSKKIWKVTWQQSMSTSKEKKKKGFYRSPAQKGLIQLHSWKPKPEKFKVTIRKNLPRKAIHFLPIDVFKWKPDMYLKNTLQSSTSYSMQCLNTLVTKLFADHKRPKHTFTGQA